MTPIRPELQATIVKWREPIALTVACLLGLWIATRSGTAITIVGLALIVTAAALLIPAIRRVRLASDEDGAGVVEINERQLAYLSADGGGLLSMDLLTEVRLAQGRWHLTDSEGNRLDIPTDTRNAHDLLEEILLLPGLDAARTVRALRSHEDVILWQSDRTARPSLSAPPH
ncbi:hypothetical protein AAD018_002760 [Aestuariibius insulae]|uniref:hypothetical protein n=1 Tax=Aestuariibius insulae TaxID=2058287 RepID=UPI00345F1336